MIHDKNTTIYDVFMQHGIALAPSPRANPTERLDGQWRAYSVNGVLFRADSRDQLEEKAYAFARRKGWIDDARKQAKRVTSTPQDLLATLTRLTKESEQCTETADVTYPYPQQKAQRDAHLDWHRGYRAALRDVRREVEAAGRKAR